MKSLQSVILLCFLFSISIPSNGQALLDKLGLLASGVNKKAPKATNHWGKLVGNWDVVFEGLDSLGKVQQSFEGKRYRNQDCGRPS